MMKLTRFSVERRLAVNFVLIIGVLVFAGGFSLYSMFVLGSLTQKIYEHPLVVSNASLRAALGITKMHRDMKDLVLEPTPARRAQMLSVVAVNEADVYLQLDLVKENILGDKGKALERETRVLLREWKPIRSEVFALMDNGNVAGAVHITQYRGAHHVARLEQKMLALTRYARIKAAGFQREAIRLQTFYEKITIALTVGAVFFALWISISATRHVVQAQIILREERNKLQQALTEIKTLRGIIPICSNCKQIRDDKGSWTMLEEYLRDHSDASFSHGICPECVKQLYPEFVIKGKNGER